MVGKRGGKEMSDMKKNGEKMGGVRAERVGKVALGMIAVGLTAGLALIAGAKKIGEKYLDENKKKD